MPKQGTRRGFLWALVAIVGLALSVGLATGGAFARQGQTVAAIPAKAAMQQAQVGSGPASAAPMLPHSAGAGLSPNTSIDAYAFLSGTNGPIPITVSIGARIDLGLIVNSGGPDNAITAQQSYINYTSSVFQVVDPTNGASCVPTTTISPDISTFDTPLQNEVCNGPVPCNFRGNIVDPGSIGYASGALNNCSAGCQGQFRVASFTLCAMNGGLARIHWEFSPPAPKTRDSEIIDTTGDTVSNPALYHDIYIFVNGATATATSTRTSTSTVTRTSTSSPTSTSTPTLTPTVTRTSTVTNTSTPTSATTNTPTATPTCGGAAGGWTAGPGFPQAGVVRAAGVWYPTNSRFYAMGGRTSDVAGSDLTHPYEYNPATNTWTAKAATWEDAQVNNMAAAVLTGPSGPRIYTVGGSAAGAVVATNKVRVYDPGTDTLSVLATDPWPADAGGDVLPGGFAVFNNKLYILGGFQINLVVTNQIWEFDPNRAAGSRWALKTAVLPVARGYVPATALGQYIYTAGGSEYPDSTTGLVDTTNTWRYDPVADQIDDASIPELPSPGTAETRALTVNGEVWVMGGGRTTPNPSSTVYRWAPGQASWSTGPNFTTARRNFPVDVQPGVAIYLVGGYAPTAPTTTMEIYRFGGVPCATSTTTSTPTGQPTNTVTRTSTSTSTATTGSTNTATSTPVGSTSTATRTNTPGITLTPSATGAATNTSTSTSVVVSTSTSTAVATATACPITFTDVLPTDYYYDAVHYLYCRGVISGYSDNTFRPYNDTTRGQLAKIIVLAEGWTINTAGGPHFTDVPTSNPFYAFIETAYNQGVVSGYADNTFRWQANVTRAQLSKIIVLAEGWAIDTTGGPHFTDVPANNPFYVYVETAYNKGIISGYADHTFRPNNNATRGQISVIVYRALQVPLVRPSNASASTGNTVSLVP